MEVSCKRMEGSPWKRYEILCLHHESTMKSHVMTSRSVLLLFCVPSTLRLSVDRGGT